MLALPVASQATGALMVLSLPVHICHHNGREVHTLWGRWQSEKDLYSRDWRRHFHSGRSLTALVALSLFVHQIVTDFYNPLTPMNIKYKFDTAIYIDWAESTKYHEPCS